MNRQLRQHLPFRWLSWLTFSYFRLRGADVARSAVLYPSVQLNRYPKNIQIGPEVIVKSWARLTTCNASAKIRVGERSTIGEQNLFYASCSIEIGNDVMFGPRVYIVDSSHSIDSVDVPMNRQPDMGSPVTIGDDCWIGAHAAILAGVTIGRGSVVGAGAVVVGDIEPFSVVGGVPAKVLKSRV